MEIRQIKQRLRKEVALRKKNLSAESLLSYSAGICERLADHPLFKQALCIAIYYSLPDEVETIRFIEKWCPYKTFLLPVIEGEEIKFLPYQGKETLRAGTFNIHEPFSQQQPLSLPPIDLIVVPGIAFDKKGNRMGRGKGYYDRFLANTNAPKTALCFNLQLFDDIPVEPFDIKMDIIITENETLLINDTYGTGTKRKIEKS